jgi:hypothetical protein
MNFGKTFIRGLLTCSILRSNFEIFFVISKPTNAIDNYIAALGI